MIWSKQRLCGFLLCLFPAALIAVPDGGSLVLILLVLASLHAIVRGNERLPLERYEIVLLALFMLFFLVYLANVLYFGSKLSELDNALRVVMLLPLYFCLRKTAVGAWYFQTSVALGALAAGGIAAYQIFVLDLPRAVGFTNPVAFGGLSMSLAMMSLPVALMSPDKRLRRLSYLAVVLGLFASLMSASRGSWAALPPVLFLFLVINPKAWSMRLRLLVIVSSMMLLLGSYAIPVVEKRIDRAVEDVRGYLLQDRAATSVGIRLETWRAALQVIREHPWLGVGEGNFRPVMREMARQGRVKPVVPHAIGHLHNEYIDAQFHRGIAGLISLLLVFLAPFYLFYRKRKAASGDSRILLLMGMSLITVTAVLSLSDIYFEQHQYTLFYFAIIYTIVSMIRYRDAAAPER